MLAPSILIPAIINGVLTGAVYALIALGLTLIYGVLHIINFAHGALLTAALFALIGYGLQRFVIWPTSHGDERNVLLVTLGLAIVIENLLLYAFHADTRTIDVPAGFDVIDVDGALLGVSRLIGFGA